MSGTGDAPDARGALLQRLVQRLQAAGLSASAVPGRLSLRLEADGLPLSLDGLPIAPEDEGSARAAEAELMALIAQIGRGEPLTLHPRICGASVAITEAVEAGARLDALPRPVRLGPRLCVLPELRLAAGRISALPLLLLSRTPLARALAHWAQSVGSLPEDDPLNVILHHRAGRAFRVDRSLRWRDPADEVALLSLIDEPALVVGGRRVGCALVHEQTGPWSARPLRRSGLDAVALALAEAEVDADLHDYNHARALFATTDPMGRLWPALRAVPHPEQPGRRLTCAAWPARATALPAADLLDVELPTGSFRVWTDAVLDVLDAVSAPIPGLWPPRFGTSGGSPPALRPRVVLAAIDRPTS